ncbi:MAG: phosphomannose isomerase type II C-terminal cupin domain [Candidatus Aminicenantes bacterium]|nr:phosphomannose isomerase type II C-terminal cupin domain [Candidatus Aminicenantes bacterium]
MKTHDKKNQTEMMIHFKNGIAEDIRPWGKFRSFPHQYAGSIKIITVNPGETLSLQYHKRRSEFWVVLDRGLEVTVGDKVWHPEKNEEIFIPAQVPHRMKCIGDSPTRLMEIWIGDSAESDIVRLEDKYGRLNKT